MLVVQIRLFKKMKGSSRKMKNYSMKIIINKLIVFMIVSILSMYIVGGFCLSYQLGRMECILVAFFAGSINIFITKILLCRLEPELGIFSWKCYSYNIVKRYNITKVDVLCCGIIVLLGGIGRFMGLMWGNGQNQQADENKLVSCVVNMVENKTPYQLSTYYYPSQLLSKLTALISAIWSQVTGNSISISSIEPYYIFRGITAFLGTLTIIIAFLIGNYYRKHLGVIFCSFVAMWPEYISLAKQVTGDVTTLFFVSITMLYSIRYIKEEKESLIPVMTLGVSAATLEKWHGAGGLGFLGLIILLSSNNIWEFIKKGLRVLFFYFIWILILAPNVIFNIKTAIYEGFIKIAVYDGHQGEPYINMLIRYIGYGVNGVTGIVFIVCIIFGIVLIIKSKDKSFSFLFYGVIKIIILSLLNRSFTRWGLEFYFNILFVVSITMWYLLFGQIGISKGWIHLKRIFGIMIVGILTVELCLNCSAVVLTSLASSNDTRMIQIKYCEANGINEYNSFSGYYTAYSPGGYIYNGEWMNRMLEEDMFLLNNGELYKKSGDIRYCIYNDEILYKSKEVLMQKEVSPELNIECQYPDLLRYSFQNASINDFSNIQTKYKTTKDIKNGANIGIPISIYNIEDINVIDDKIDVEE